MIATYRYIKKKRAQKQQTQGNAAAVSDPEQRQETKQVTAVDSEQSSAAAAAEKSAARKYRWKLLLCLTPAFFLASLDFTIIASALPFIASHFDKLNQLNWIVTAFTLTSTAFIPLFGQLADTFGRHATLQAAVIILTIGSILCAAAPVWAVLLLGRALQGVGTAGAMNVIMIALADKVSLKEQALNTSIFQLLNGVGYAVGPVVGGYITNANWRYCFVLCAGLGALSMPLIFLLRKDFQKGSIPLSQSGSRSSSLLSGLATLDFGGTFLFIFGVGLIILATAWGGSSFAWNSAGVIAPLVIGAVLCIVFVAYEYLLESGRVLSRLFPRTVALTPFSVLRQKDVGLVCFIGASSGAALYSVFYFIGIYFTVAEAYPASKSGVQLLYYIPGIGIGVYAAIFFCNVWPRHTFWPLSIGTVVETVGIAVLTYAVKRRNNVLVNVMMGVSGLGTGLRFMPSNLHLAGMFADQLAAVYSLLRFALPFGGTLALTIMGSVFQNKMAAFFGTVNNSSGFSLHSTGALDSIAKLPPDQQNQIRSSGADATMWAFISILPILGLSLIASLGLGNVRIPSKQQAKEAEAAGLQHGGTEVWDGVYLLQMGRPGRQVNVRETSQQQKPLQESVNPV